MLYLLCVGEILQSMSVWLCKWKIFNVKIKLNGVYKVKDNNYINSKRNSKYTGYIVIVSGHKKSTEYEY